jgi:hypothetical protein
VAILQFLHCVSDGRNSTLLFSIKATFVALNRSRRPRRIRRLVPTWCRHRNSSPIIGYFARPTGLPGFFGARVGKGWESDWRQARRGGSDTRHDDRRGASGRLRARELLRIHYHPIRPLSASSASSASNIRRIAASTSVTRVADRSSAKCRLRSSRRVTGSTPIAPELAPGSPAQ